MLEVLGQKIGEILPGIALSVAKIALLIAGYIVCRMLIGIVTRRVFFPKFLRDKEGGDPRTARVRSLETMLRSLLEFVLGFVVLVMLLQIFGLNIVPLLTTAGVAGLAVGFGAQKLVRDVISGIFIILEDQYGVGDYVSIGAVTGTVEVLGIRTTSVRDIQGRLTIISNGIVEQACNHSRGIYTLGLEYPVGSDISGEDARDAIQSACKLLRERHPDVVDRAELCDGFMAISGASRTYKIEIDTKPILADAAKRLANDCIATALSENKIKLL